MARLSGAASMSTSRAMMFRSARTAAREGKEPGAEQNHRRRLRNRRGRLADQADVVHAKLEGEEVVDFGKPKPQRLTGVGRQERREVLRNGVVSGDERVADVRLVDAHQ